MKPLLFSELSPARQKLIRLCQRVNFGSIPNISVIEGEVNLESLSEIVFDIRLDQEAARTELELNDFILNTETRRLLAHIDAVGHGTMEIIIHDGIPRRLIMRCPFEECQ